MRKIIFLLPFILFSCQHSPRIASPDKIDHVVVIYLENHSFYNLFANFPGADNKPPKNYKGQVDNEGNIYKTLPIIRHDGTQEPDLRFSNKLKNSPFRIDDYCKQSELSPDPRHEFYTSQVQINNGKMDRFAAHSNVGGFIMGYYDMKKSHLWQYAREFTLADNFFQSAFGGSFLNHQYLIAARAPLIPTAPKSQRMTLDKNGTPLAQKVYTPDGYGVNTVVPFNFPTDPTRKESDRLPTYDYKNIGDLMSEAGVSWAWFSGGWNKILRGERSEHFEYHHQPFVFFKNYGPGTTGRKEHLKDEEDLFASLQNGKLPQVSFYKPIGNENAHPGYSTIESGDEKMHAVIEAIRRSPFWKSTLIVVTFDENGGFWDPKAPPKGDRFGPGVRVPAIYISPWVKKGFIDHTQSESLSIIAYIEKRFGLPHLTERDAKADPLSHIFE